MKRFRFTLAPLLHVKKIGERLAEGKLLSARLVVSACQDRLAGLQHNLDELSGSLTVGGPLADWSATFDRASRLEVAIRAAEAALAEAEAALLAAQQAWSAIAREVEALETMEREQRAAHRAERLANEQERLHETSLRQWSRNPRQEESG